MNDEKNPSPPNDIRDTSWRRPHFELNFKQESVFRFLVMTAAAIVIFAGIKAASSINTALKKLIDKELVYKTQDGYIVYDRFMAIWLRSQLY